MWANYEGAVETRGVEYVVFSRHGKEKDLTLLLMEANHFVHNLFYANPSHPRKYIHTVVLTIYNNYK